MFRGTGRGGGPWVKAAGQHNDKPLDRLLTVLLPLLLLLCHVFTPSPPLLSAVGHIPNVLVNWGYFGVVFKNNLGTFGLYFMVVLWLVWCFLDF